MRFHWPDEHRHPPVLADVVDVQVGGLEDLRDQPAVLVTVHVCSPTVVWRSVTPP